MHCSGTVLSSLARTVLRAYEDSGANRASVARDVLGNPDILEEPESRLPFAAYARMWDLCGQASGDPEFAVRAASRSIQAGTFGVVGFLARSASTLREALECVVDHGALLNNTSRTLLFLEGETAVIRDGPADPNARWPRHKAEFVMAAYVLLTLEWAGVSGQPVAVSFQHEARPDLDQLHSVFGADVRFDAAFNELRFPAAWLERALPMAEPELFAFLRRQGEHKGSKLEPARDLLAEIRRVVVQSLPHGAPSLEEVARSDTRA